MNLEEVKLTIKEESKVVASFLYHEIGWRYIISAAIGFMLMAFNVDCGCGPTAGWLLPGLVGAVGGLMVGSMIIDGLPELWRNVKPELMRTYNKHKRKVQKESLDKVDDQLLK